MQRREAEKSAVLAEIAAVLDVIGRERRMPDHWERVCLFDAFTAVFAGCYGVAISQARLALIPASERSSEVRLLTDPIYDQCDLPLFTRVFQAAQSEPAHRFPHFGPVKLKEAITKDSAKSWLRQTI